MNWINLSDIYTHRATGAKLWVECSQEQYDQLLNVLPPIDMNATGYLQSEPYTHEEGRGVYMAAKEQGGKFYMTLATIAEYRDGYQDFKHQ